MRDRVLQALEVLDARALRLRAESEFAGVTRHKAPPPHVQSSHGRKGAKGTVKAAAKKVAKAATDVREALTRARSSEEVARAVAAEASRLTGRKVDVNFSGADVRVARGYGEGLLSGLERFPGVPLIRVRMYGEPDSPPGIGMAAATSSHDTFSAYGDVKVGGEIDTISFNAAWASDGDRIHDTLREKAAGKSSTQAVYDSPRGVAIHEFGHVVAHHADAEAAARSVARRRQRASGERISTSALVKRDISRYASRDDGELAAEAFADVMLNGDEASELSREIFDEIERRYAKRRRS
jgi:hypothetical protein